MRLTLRTMLAYMDDILEPTDAEDIGHKIADSEFATGLMSRVRDVTRRMRLSAPKLRGRAMGVDPNTVAEYLDNTLSPERVPEFEKICLESDVHLAEVASSHQILALVLGEPAEVTQNCRERMYHLVHHQVSDLDEPEVVEAEITVAPLPEPAPQAGHARPRPEVPEYLRQAEPHSGGAWQLALAAALMVLLGGAIWMAVRPDGAPQLAANIESADNRAADNEAPPAAGLIDPAAPQGDPQAPADADAALAENAPESLSATRATIAAPRTVEQAPATIAAPSTDSTADGTAAPEAADGDPFAPSQSEPAAIADAPAPADALSEVNVERSNPPAPDGANPAADDASGADVGEALGAAPVTPVGRVTTNRQVLLALSSDRSDWRRTGSNATIYTGDVLLSPPTYRSTVALRSGVTMELLGASRVTLLPADAAGVSGVALEYGRMVLMNIDAAGAALRIAAPGLEGVLTFAAGESAVALETSPLRNEGADPEAGPPQWNVDLYAVSGQVAWQPAGQPPAEPLAAPLHRRIAGLAPAAALAADEFPTWIVADRLKPIEQKASDALEQALRGDRAIRLSLRELVDDRKEEVRAIAARTLGQLDDFEPLLMTLSNPHQQAYWSEQVELLRSAVARGPETAAQVRQAVEVRRGKAAPKAYRLLWGYTDQQLQQGGAADLVANLDDDDLLVRVLSFWNLRSVSGGRTLNYRPEDPPAKRQPHVQKWRQRQAEGQIRIGQAS